MELVRKENQQWHFAEEPRCDWADSFENMDAIDERRTVESLEEVRNVCVMCKDMRD